MTLHYIQIKLDIHLKMLYNYTTHLVRSSNAAAWQCPNRTFRTVHRVRSAEPL